MIIFNRRVLNDPTLVSRIPTEIEMRRPLQVDAIELRVRQGTVTPLIPTPQGVLQQIQSTRPVSSEALGAPPRRFSLLAWLTGKYSSGRRRP